MKHFSGSIGFGYITILVIEIAEHDSSGGTKLDTARLLPAVVKKVSTKGALLGKL
jgi:hypothetical protein